MSNTYHSHATPSETANNLGGGSEKAEMKVSEATTVCGCAETRTAGHPGRCATDATR